MGAKTDNRDEFDLVVFLALGEIYDTWFVGGDFVRLHNDLVALAGIVRHLAGVDS